MLISSSAIRIVFLVEGETALTSAGLLAARTGVAATGATAVATEGSGLKMSCTAWAPARIEDLTPVGPLTFSASGNAKIPITLLARSRPVLAAGVALMKPRPASLSCEDRKSVV